MLNSIKYCPLCNRKTPTVETLDRPFAALICAACGFVHRLIDRDDEKDDLPRSRRPEARSADRIHAESATRGA